MKNIFQYSSILFFLHPLQIHFFFTLSYLLSFIHYISFLSPFSFSSFLTYFYFYFYFFPAQIRIVSLKKRTNAKDSFESIGFILNTKK